MANSTFESLLEKYLLRSLTDEERLTFSQMLEHQEHQQKLMAIMDRELEEHAFEAEEDKNTLALIQEGIQKRIREKKQPLKVVRFHWKRVTVAASLILVVGLYIFREAIFNKSAEKENVVQQQPTGEMDFAPGNYKALLKLADGTTIWLDSTQPGVIAQQGAVTIVKSKEGQLTYKSVPSVETEVRYNTITTPKGGQYQVTLADGTKVWLNAASRLHFPAFFTNSKRKVELNGEGYFEVAKNKVLPFIVNVNKLDIEVLGTHFNVNAYDDEASVRTTLLEGKVKVSNRNNSKVLHPGQQAIENLEGEIFIEENVNVDEVIAWKKGMFQFQSAELETILRQVARWYDIDFVYKEKITERFSGQISRNVNASQLLQILELTGKVHFQLEGRKIIVKP